MKNDSSVFPQTFATLITMKHSVDIVVRITSVFIGTFFWASLAGAGDTVTWSDAVKRTASENPEILGARENVRASEARKSSAYSGFLPTIKASVGYETTERSGTLTVPATTGTGWTAGINGNWNLFAGFVDTAKVAQAEADLRSAQASAAIVSARLSADLKSAFEAVAYSRDYAKLTTQILKRREENLRLVQLRFESGRENKGSVLLSEAYLEQARFDDLQARNSLRTAAVSLAKILALDGDGTAVVEVVGNVPISDPGGTPNFSALVLGTPDYLQAIEQSKSLEEARRIARASFFPSLDLTSSIGKRGNDFFPNEQDTKTVGITLSIPLFTGGRNLNSYRAAVATAAAAEFTRDNTVREIRRKLEMAWAGYLESVARLRTDESFKKAALVRSEVGRTKYNNGLLSFDDWDIIENDLITRQKTVLQTRRDRATAEGAWEQAQGKGVLQ